MGHNNNNHNHNNDNNKQFHEILQELISPKYRNITIPLWITWFSFGLVYYGIILFVTRVYEETDNDDDDDGPICDFAYQDIFINASMEVIGIIIATLTLDTYGRILTQFVGYFLAGIGVFFMGFGQIQAGAIEASNIDITTELSTLIRAQQAFNGNAKLLQTENKVLSSLMR